MRNSRGVPGRSIALVVTAAALVAAGLASPVAADAAPSTPSLAPGIDTSSRALTGKVDQRHTVPAGVPKKGNYAFLLKLDETSTAAAQKRARSRGAIASKQAARSQYARIRSAQSNVVADLPANSSVLYRTHSALAGVAVRTNVKNFAALTDIAGVSAVYPISPKKRSNATAVPLQRAPQAWVAHGDRGANSTIAIIDSGIDYTHADFGGPGTPAAYKTAQANEGKPADPSLYPNAKVVGGYDFVGDKYNPDPDADPDGPYPPDPTATPDTNPLDCDGHGSHVAGSAAGYGVNANGSTYTDGYDTSTPFNDLKIGPGMAPEAKLYAFRVFGCVGSTDLTGAAIERAMDPNGDGVFTDHVDVANLSLGSDFGSPQDGDTMLVQAASAAGVTMVVSSGNNGDLYDTGGSPGNARSALTVAASQDNGSVVDALDVASPKATYASQRSAAFDFTKGDLAGPVYRLTDSNNVAGCNEYSAADKANAKGKIVFLEWTDNDAFRACGSVDRGEFAVQAGAKGFIFGNDRENFAAGITGVSQIPGVIVAKSGADAIRRALGFGTAVTIGSTTANAVKQDDAGLNDTLSEFSSRGIRSAGNLKPDVTAVGATVFSAAVGTGSDGVNESGTSMSAPMTSGLAGLVTSLNPDWTPEQVKADIVNTAGQDLFVGTNHSGAKYAPNRVGTGRIDAEAAVNNTVLAYTSDDPGSVSASFGPLEAASATLFREKTIKVQNMGNSSVTYDVSLQSRSTIPGADFAVSPASVTVPPNSSENVSITLTITRATLTKTIDPTADRKQGGIPRDYVADASGLIVFTPTTGTAPNLRVAYYAAPRPTATMTQPASLTLPVGAVQTTSLPLSGGGIGQGSGDDSITSAVSGFELQATSPVLPTCSATITTGCTHYPDEKSADLRYVGATSSAPLLRAHGQDPVTSANGLAYFAIATQGPWRSPVGFQEYDLYADTDRDGVADVVVYNDRLTGTDTFVATTVDLDTGDSTIAPINDRLGDVDTAVFDSDTLVLPVPLSALPGINAAKSRITYAVEAVSTASGLVDTVGSVADNLRISHGLSFDVLHPGLAVYGSYDGVDSPELYRDSPGTSLTVRRDASAYALDNGQGALLVHFHNKTGNKAQAVALSKAPTRTTLSVAPRTVRVGQNAVATITVSGPSGAPSGTVTLKAGTTVLGTATLVAGRAKINYKRSTPGSLALTAGYAGSSVYTASASARAPLTVIRAKVASAVKLTFTPAKVKVRKTTTVRISVRNTNHATPTGTFTLRIVRAHGKTATVASGRLVKGTAKIRYKAKRAGKARYRIYYNGDGYYLAGHSATGTLKVKK